MTNLTTLQQQPIDVQKREVSRLVWEAQGKEYPGEDWMCPPDITDPAVFWPLVEEMRKKGWTIEFHPDYVSFWIKPGDGFVAHFESGLAIGYAYLKIKEQENER